jgi:hypothetical protein
MKSVILLLLLTNCYLVFGQNQKFGDYSGEWKISTMTAISFTHYYSINEPKLDLLQYSNISPETVDQFYYGFKYMSFIDKDTLRINIRFYNYKIVDEDYFLLDPLDGNYSTVKCVRILIKNDIGIIDYNITGENNSVIIVHSKLSRLNK